MDYSHAEFLGKELWEIGLFSDKQASQAVFKQLQRTGYLRYEDLPLQAKNGRPELISAAIFLTERYSGVA